MTSISTSETSPFVCCHCWEGPLSLLWGWGWGCGIEGDRVPLGLVARLGLVVGVRVGKLCIESGRPKAREAREARFRRTRRRMTKTRQNKTTPPPTLPPTIPPTVPPPIPPSGATACSQDLPHHPCLQEHRALFSDVQAISP